MAIPDNVKAYQAYQDWKKLRASKPQYVATIRKADLLEIRISFSSFKDREFVDVREWYLSRETGEWKPSQKGFTLPIEVETIEDVRDGLTAVIALLEER